MRVFAMFADQFDYTKTLPNPIVRFIYSMKYLCPMFLISLIWNLIYRQLFILWWNKQMRTHRRWVYPFIDAQ